MENAMTERYTMKNFVMDFFRFSKRTRGEDRNDASDQMSISGVAEKLFSPFHSLFVPFLCKVHLITEIAECIYSKFMLSMQVGMLDFQTKLSFRRYTIFMILLQLIQ